VHEDKRNIFTHKIFLFISEMDDKRLIV